jgi:hypothetical protein
LSPTATQFHIGKRGVFRFTIKKGCVLAAFFIYTKSTKRFRLSGGIILKRSLSRRLIMFARVCRRYHVIMFLKVLCKIFRMTKADLVSNLCNG